MVLQSVNYLHEQLTTYNKAVILPSRDSPFFTEELDSSKWTTEPPSLCMAAENEQLVLVLTSKNMDAITFPYNIET